MWPYRSPETRDENEDCDPLVEDCGADDWGAFAHGDDSWGLEPDEHAEFLNVKRGWCADRKQEKEFDRWRNGLLSVGALGLLVVFVAGMANDPGWQFHGAFAVVAVALAAFAFGAFGGFLFSIPRAVAGKGLRNAPLDLHNFVVKNEDGTEGRLIRTDREAVAERRAERAYRENTNLEEISDWLTKIIVGLTLVEADSILAVLKKIGHAAGPLFLAVKNEPSRTDDIIALAVIVFFVVLGFLFTYLWVRINLERLFRLVADKTDTDLAAAAQARREKAAEVKRLLKEGSQTGDHETTAAKAEALALDNLEDPTVQIAMARLLADLAPINPQDEPGRKLMETAEAAHDRAEKTGKRPQLVAFLGYLLKLKRGEDLTSAERKLFLDFEKRLPLTKKEREAAVELLAGQGATPEESVKTEGTETDTSSGEETGKK